MTVVERMSSAWVAFLAGRGPQDAAAGALLVLPHASVLLASSALAWGAYHRYDTAVLRLRTINEEQTRLCLEVVEEPRNGPGPEPIIASILQRRVLDLETAINAVRASAGISKSAAVLQQMGTVLAVAALVAATAFADAGAQLARASWLTLAAAAVCVGLGACAQVIEVVLSAAGLNEESYAALAGRKAPHVKTAISRYMFARQCLLLGRADDAEAALVSKKAEEDLHGPAGHYLMGKIHLSRGAPMLARKHFATAVAMDRTLWPAQLEIAAIDSGHAAVGGLADASVPKRRAAAATAFVATKRASEDSRVATDDLMSSAPASPLPRAAEGRGASAPAVEKRGAMAAAVGWTTTAARYAVMLWAFVVYVGGRRGVMATLVVALLSYLRGQGWRPTLPTWESFHAAFRQSRGLGTAGASADRPGAPRQARRSRSLAPGPHPPSLGVLPPEEMLDDPDAWYVGEDDLGFFKYRIEQEGEVPGASAWSHMMDKKLPGATYTAWRRMLPTGKTEYKSVTTVDDATAEEFHDFFLDDPARLQWDPLLTRAHVVETGGQGDRRQVVHWVRSFPFSFIKERDYVIARRTFVGSDGAIYGITKSCRHPRALPSGQILRCDIYYSMWRAVTIPSPFTPGGTACQTTLLHHEDFRINERLARFAVSAGMGNFVRSLVTFFQDRFRPARRQRAEPTAPDPSAFGLDKRPDPLSREEMAIVGVGPLARPSEKSEGSVAPSSPRRMGPPP